MNVRHSALDEESRSNIIPHKKNMYLHLDPDFHQDDLYRKSGRVEKDCFSDIFLYYICMYLLLSPADIYYLTGVTIHEVGEVVIIMNNEQGTMNNEGSIFCDARTSGLFDAEHFEIISDREKWGEVLGTYETLQTDPDILTQTLRIQIEEYGVQLTMAPSPIAEQRMIKTPEEILKLRESQRINKAVYAAIEPYLQIGVTEREIARRIQILQLELGASGPSFPPIVAFGENTAVPHHSPTKRKLQSGEVVLIDMGVVYEGYCSDMTRCLFM